MIVIAFGLAASGKTYVGQTLAKFSSFHHEDADRWLSLEMKKYIAEKKQFTLEMLDCFTNNIISHIDELRKTHDNLIITQALYRQKNRLMIKDYFLKKDKIIFLQLEADDQIIHDRLVKRADWVFPEYAESLKKYFEPMEDAKIIRNNKEGEEDIVSQLATVNLIFKSDS